MHARAELFAGMSIAAFTTPFHASLCVYAAAGQAQGGLQAVTAISQCVDLGWR